MVFALQIIKRKPPDSFAPDVVAVILEVLVEIP
jgi:hypothetical protein